MSDEGKTPLPKRGYTYRLSRRELLIASSAAALAACAPAATPGPNATATGAAASPGKELKLGGVMSFTKVFAELGIGMRRAIELYLEQNNNRLANRPVRAIWEDEQDAPAIALQRVQKLIDQDQVDLLIGIVITGSAYAIRNTVDSSKTVWMCTNAGGNVLTRDVASPPAPARKSPYVFRSSFNAYQVSVPMGEWVATKRNVKEVFMAYTDFAFGQESAVAFTETFTKAGGKIAGEVKPALGAAEMNTFVTRIKGQPVKDVWCFFSGTDAIKFIQAWKQLGMSEGGYKLYGAGFATEQDVLKEVKDQAVGMTTSLHWALTLDNAENRKFVEDYQRKYNEVPATFAVQAWDGIRAFDEALKKTQGNSDDKTRFIAALEDVRFNGPRGAFEFDKETHHVVQDIWAREVRMQGGQAVNVHLEKIGNRVRDPGR